ncbi:MAG: DUF192 domain-containing protein [Actinomycetota bacterium]
MTDLTDLSDLNELPSWAPSWVPTVDDKAGVAKLRWAIWAVLALGLLAFVARGADRPDDPAFADAVRPRVPIPGFAEVAVVLIDLAGQAVEHCVLAADTPEQQAGLAGVNDLVGYAGMLVRLPQPAAPPVSASGAPTPLSVAFFDQGGVLVGASEVPPCPTGTAPCPAAVPPGVPFSYALTLPQGSLETMGVELGTRLEVRGACPP